MKLNDFVEMLRRYPAANELSVHSDGGYFYLVVDKTGERVNPAELGINLELECGDYVRVDGNIYSQTATITPSDDEDVDGHVRNVTQYSNSGTIIVEGDIP